MEEAFDDIEMEVNAILSTFEDELFFTNGFILGTSVEFDDAALQGEKEDIHDLELQVWDARIFTLQAEIIRGRAAEERLLRQKMYAGKRAESEQRRLARNMKLAWK